MRSYYDVHDLKLAVDSSDNSLVGILDIYLSPFANDHLNAVDFIVNVERGEVAAPPADAQIVHDGEILPGVAAKVFILDDRRWYVFPGRFSIQLDKQFASLRVHPDCNRELLVYCAIHVLNSAFTQSGQFLVHGAALVAPGTDQALLIFAPSGRGKTTTALALALSGFALMTDDAIVISQQSDGNSISWTTWGLPRALKVHKLTAQLLPPIAALLKGTWDRHGEEILQSETLASVANVAPAQRFSVGALAILGERTNGSHRISEISKTAAIQHLAMDNIRITPAGLPKDQVAMFNALSSLVRDHPTFEICVGRELDALAHEVLTECSLADI
jgi:hypothetical protein